MKKLQQKIETMHGAYVDNCAHCSISQEYKAPTIDPFLQIYDTSVCVRYHMACLLSELITNAWQFNCKLVIDNNVILPLSDKLDEFRLDENFLSS